MSNTKQRHWATRPFDYAGNELDRGQIVELTGQVNDEKLLRLGYVRPYEGLVKDLVQCPECGKEFYDHEPKIAHVRLRHADLDEVELDRLLEREERVAERLTPLKMDKTAASMAA